MIKAGQKKNIFCLEGLWEEDLRKPTTVQPMLELLFKCYGVKYIYRDCATKEEFMFYIDEWTKKRYEKYPILYLGFHGEEEKIQLAGWEELTLEEIANRLKEYCNNRIIIFASCSTLDTDNKTLKRFLETTGALAICGYRSDVDWLKSTAFELLLMKAMQDNEFSGRGIGAIADRFEYLKKQFKDLEFQYLTIKDL